MSSREEWNKLMRGLPDGAFMEIMNNYLGGVQTPYDKNELLQRLFQSLSLPENLRRTAARVSPEDLRLLSAVECFHRPDRHRLIEFFSGTLSPSRVTAGLISLEERLLLFFDRSARDAGLVLSPLLPREVREQLGPARLIRFRGDNPPSPGGMPLITGSFLICFFSLLNEDPRICNHDGSVKKRFTSALTRVFPAAGFTDEPNETLHLLLNALQTLGLLSEHSGEWRLKTDNLKAFSSLDRRQQLLWVWGALCTREQARAGLYSSWIAALAGQIPPGAGLSLKDMENLLHLLRERNLPGEGHLNPSHTIRVLRRFGFLCSGEELLYLHPMIPPLLQKEAPGAGTFFLHATFDANLTPETPFSLPLALSLTADRYDSFSQLRLTGGSFRRLLQAGLSLETLEEELEKRYALPLPQNILFSLRDWQEDYGGIRLWEGVVMEVRRDRLTLVKQSPRLMNLVRRTLAEGVYLLAREDRKEWEEAMAGIGIETIPRTESPGRKGPRVMEYLLEETPSASLFSPASPAEEPEGEEKTREERLSLKEHVRHHSGLSQDEREEFLGRVERGVVYREDQIRPGIIRRELTLVKGLDYQGKLRMIQGVLGNRAYTLEITLPTEDFDLETHRIIPRALEQEKDGQTLFTGTGTDGKPFQCPVRKISRIRKIRSSLF